ncbi:MAG: M36 family metallopeptidase [Ginsengibacter sp.]
MRRKIYAKFLPFFVFALLSFYFSFAQKIEVKEALDLVIKNSSFLNLSSADIKNSIITNAYIDKASNTKLIYVQQSFMDIPVYNSVQVIALKNDIAISGSGQRIFKLSEATTNAKGIPAISAKEAVSAAARSVKISESVISGETMSILSKSANNQKFEFRSSGISKENLTADLQWFPGEKGAVKLGWQVKILPENSSDYWLIMVDANDASILKKDNLTVSCNWDSPIVESGLIMETPFIPNTKLDKKNSDVSFAVSSAGYRVTPYPFESMSHPGGTPVLVNEPWLNAGAANPVVVLGWHHDGTTEYSSTRGNNVMAIEDNDGSDITVGASAVSTTGLPNLNFDFAFDPLQQPGVVVNKNAAITQLFYWNNIMHDISYQYGFDEISGNFQNSNQGRGGVGNDYVIADAQDGNSINNANFATPADGSKPRMQMYLWRASPYKMITINPPTPFSGTIAALEGTVSTANLLANIGPVTGNLVLYMDGAGTTHEACEAAGNAAALAGNIAVIDRGTCDFVTKIKNAQNAGAIAVLVINNVDGTISVMNGTDNTITIPALMIFKSNGDFIKDLFNTDPAVTINFTLSAIKLDGDFDNGVIGHEYAHGISNRLTGGPALATCLQNKEQMGEGWSDYFALMTTTNWATTLVSDGNKKRSIGTYASGALAYTSNGIRKYPYSTDISINPWTYGLLSAIVDGEPHYVGEIWAATLWDMTWNIIQTDGINTNFYNADGAGGNSVAMKLVSYAMKLQPCSPGFLDGRDAILKADEILYNSSHSCSIWTAFARRGMGINALQGSSNSTTDQTENFAVPSGAVLKKTVDKGLATENEILTYTFKLRTQCASVANYKILDTLAANVTYIAGSGGTYNATDRVVSFNIVSQAASQVQTFSFKVKVNSGTYFASSIIFSETIPVNAVPASLEITPLSGATWVPNTTNHSAPYSMNSTATNSATEQILSSSASYLIAGHSQLSFWQQYNTEAFHDGGVVELSKDNGLTWFDAGPYISMNGYNTNIYNNTSLANKQAYSGSSSGFIKTIVNLSSFEGKSLKFRFRFVTDNTVSGGTGWIVDDIVISKDAAVYNLAWVYDNLNGLRSLSDTVTSISEGALPLSWGVFQVAKQGSTAQLKWSTIQEVDVDKFYVERSKDGVHFSTIAVTNSSGNSDRVSEYSYTDEAPINGINFYRIRQTDRNGQVSYTEVRTVEFSRLIGIVSVSPNPAKDYVNIKIEGNKETLKVKLLNASGQVLNTFTVKEEYYRLPVSSLAAGVYYLKITGTTISGVEKLIIEK